MSVSSVSDELGARFSLALDPFEDMCAPKSQATIPAFKVTDLSWPEDASGKGAHAACGMQHKLPGCGTACARLASLIWHRDVTILELPLACSHL